MDFSSRLLPCGTNCIFREEGYFVWGASMFRHGENIYMVYSRWEKSKGFDAWVTDSELCLAKGQDALGTFEHVKVIGPNRPNNAWYGSCMHNPTVISANGKHYLYFMGNRGDGDWWQHRNRQRIGVAWTDDPENEWHILPDPVIDVTPGAIDSRMVSNPTAVHFEDGKTLMVYKAVSDDGPEPAGGAVICGVAEAEDPLGPFKKHGKPIMVNPQNPWSVEDPFIWRENGRLYALVKDFHGYFTGIGTCSTALFESQDGYEWNPASRAPAFGLAIPTKTGMQPVKKLERPQIFFDEDGSAVLLCACMPKDETDTYNIRIPLRKAD